MKQKRSEVPEKLPENNDLNLDLSQIREQIKIYVKNIRDAETFHENSQNEISEKTLQSSLDSLYELGRSIQNKYNELNRINSPSEKIKEEKEGLLQIINEITESYKKYIPEDTEIESVENDKEKIKQEEAVVVKDEGNFDFESLSETQKRKKIKSLTPGMYAKKMKKMGLTPETEVVNSFEAEQFTSYESIIKSITENKNPEARTIFLNEHIEIIEDLRKQMKDIVDREGDEVLNLFITEQQEQINTLIQLLKEKGSFDKEEGGLLLNALRNDFDLLEENKKEIKKEESTVAKKTKKEEEIETEPVTEWAGYGLIDINNPKEPLYISYKDLVIMMGEEGFFAKVKKAIDEHNENIKKKVGREVLDKSMEEIEKTIADFKKIKEEWQQKINDGLEEESKKKKEKKKKNTKESSEENSKNEEVSEETPTNEDKIKDENESDTETRIFYTEESVDYHEISNDKEFDNWLDNIETYLKKDAVDIRSEIKSLSEWYNEYQEFLPYIKKLNEVFEDIEKKEGKNKIKSIASKEKINNLIYEMHTGGQGVRDVVDSIFKEYTKSKILSKEKADLEKTLSELSRINNKRGDLSNIDVRKVLESKGSENIENNINLMLNFLRDLHNNYSGYYSNANEHGDDDMMKIYKKIKSSEANGSKLNWAERLIKTTKRWVSPKPDYDEYTMTKNLISKSRDFNLVDRKTGKREDKILNQARMEKLIGFIEGQAELLIEHIQNPESNKAEFFDDEEKEILKMFDEMYKIYSKDVYFTKSAKTRAKEMLGSDEELKNRLENMEEIPETIETLFDNDDDFYLFENMAEIRVATEGLNKLSSELNKFPKGKNINEFLKLKNKFDLIESKLEELGEIEGNDEIGLKIKTIKLKMEDLEIRHINKEVYRDISVNFVKYESIINSTDRTVEEKQVYIKDLLEALKKHRLNKANTRIQNGVLDDTIKRYEKVLKDLK